MRIVFSDILDSESVPLRIEFGKKEHLSEINWEGRTALLCHELAAVLPNNPFGHSVDVVALQPLFVDLLVGWIDFSDKGAVLDCVEKVFPEAISAHLGHDAFPELLEKSKHNKKRSEKVYVGEKKGSSD